MRKQLVEQVKKELDANKIEIPFPQRVVYFADQATAGQKTGLPLSEK
jgi:small-conductance mechanosensitive channel